MKILAFLLLAYGASAVLARVMAARALYRPELASREAPSGVQTVTDAHGNRIALLHLPNPRARFTIWFFHGNAEALGDLGPMLQALHDAGFAVFAFDYPGYGVSTGRPTEESLYAASRAARDHLRNELRVPAERTILFGRSLGGGPAVQMATEEPVAGVVLQSAFVSVFRVVTRWHLLPFDYFHNARKLRRVDRPVLIVHGTQDNVIPFRHAPELLAAAQGPTQHLWVEGAGHNDFYAVAGVQFWDTLRDFSALCAGREAPP